MTKNRDSKCVWLAGASVLAMGLLAPTAVAQEDGESTRTLSTVTVTTQKVEESIQDVPIAVSAFDEEALNRLQLTGGPDLVKSIPNVTFTKGNFSGFNFKIRFLDLLGRHGNGGKCSCAFTFLLGDGSGCQQPHGQHGSASQPDTFRVSVFGHLIFPPLGPAGLLASS